ncbi:hypothetical protein LR48_Vigan10g261900 [Vigna angularis]|uniref:Uncharacterized protein n=1 Tax=Phaseolus angularis TaxID=3914 RepID=A0A0L9VPA1_PHAAN|nr:hypothetical protein LR48_Vigan10g261900 [Vigna angularis]
MRYILPRQEGDRSVCANTDRPIAGVWKRASGPDTSTGSLHSAPLPNARLPLLTSTRMIIAMTRRTYKNNGQHKENERISPCSYDDRAPEWYGNWHSHQLPPEISPCSYDDRAPEWYGNWHSHQLPPEVSPFRPNYSYVTVPSKLQLCDGDLLPFPRMTYPFYVKTSSHGISGSNRLLSLATVTLYKFS